MFHTFARKLTSFVRLPLFSIMWLAPVWLLLGIGRVLIRAASFQRMAPHLGRLTGAAPWVPLLDPAQCGRAREIARTVRLAARYTPWDSNCFPQAVAARVLLGLYGIPYAMYFGLMSDSRSVELKAHAWIAAGPVRVSGGGGFDRFTVVAVFVAPGLVS